MVTKNMMEKKSLMKPKGDGIPHKAGRTLVWTTMG